MGNLFDGVAPTLVHVEHQDHLLETREPVKVFLEHRLGRLSASAKAHHRELTALGYCHRHRVDFSFGYDKLKAWHRVSPQVLPEEMIGLSGASKVFTCEAILLGDLLARQVVVVCDVTRLTVKVAYLVSETTASSLVDTPRL
jgi:hypothetical protein